MENIIDVSTEPIVTEEQELEGLQLPLREINEPGLRDLLQDTGFLGR